MTRAEVLAILPARGGSKGIPRKNIRPFAGYPLIAYSIAAARQAEMVTRVIVSTDDEEIAEVARHYGAETPFMRPAELATDRTMDLPVFQHAVSWLEEHEGYHPEIVLHLHPTSPVRPRGALDRAIRQMLEHPEADCTRSVVEPLQSPFKMWRIDEKSGQMVPLVLLPGIKEPYNTPRQLLPFTYLQTGHVNAIRPQVILGGSMTGQMILPLIIDGRFEVDLDTLADWEHGEWVVAQGKLDMVWPGPRSRGMPENVRLLVMDFDGVVTDNRVWVDQDGREMVAANRSDSLGLSRLRQAGVDSVVISMETNPVVAARCRKMNVPWIQGENDKAAALKKLLKERGVEAGETVFLGNDVNDLPCFPLVGWAVAVSDAMPEVARQADHVLSRKGGHAAVRELCDLIMAGKGMSEK